MAKATQLTANGDRAFDHTGSHFIEFFSKAGSLRAPDGKPNKELIALFKSAFHADRLMALRLMFWTRGFREGGAGNRSGFRCILNWLAKEYPEIVEANLAFIPKYGRWDDLYALYNTPVEKQALGLWANAILSQDRLACKWADRADRKLSAHMGLTPKGFRKAVVAGSSTIEQLMCAQDWASILYQCVPSKAMAMYCKAFEKRDTLRYGQYKEALKKGTTKVNVGAIGPIDLVQSARHGDDEMADLQFEALKPLFAGDKRPMACTDFSGSMSSAVPGSKYSCRDVALALGLYFSAKIEKTNPFYKKFLAFSERYKLISWNGMSFHRAVATVPGDNSFVENTNIEKALTGLLNDGLKAGATAAQFPTHIIIVSDMQFDSGSDSSTTSVEAAMKKWDTAGIPRPAIIYWNVSDSKTSPATAYDKNIALVSGFSQGIANAILAVDKTDPFTIMLKALEPYQAVLP